MENDFDMKTANWLQSRRPRTVLFMMTATLVGFGLTFCEDMFGGIVWMLPSLLLGLAIILSNLSFLRYGIASILIPLLFLGIYLFGTMPFGVLGDNLFDSTFFAFVFCCLGCLLLTSVVVRIFLKNVGLSYRALLLMIPLALITEVIYAVLMGQTYAGYKVHPGDFRQKVLLYQSAITLFTILMMRQAERRSSDV